MKKIWFVSEWCEPIAKQIVTVMQEKPEIMASKERFILLNGMADNESSKAFCMEEDKWKALTGMTEIRHKTVYSAEITFNNIKETDNGDYIEDKRDW